MSLRHQRSPYRWHVDRFVMAALPRVDGRTGLDVGGPSPQPRPMGQQWTTINPAPGARAEYLGVAEDLGTFDDREFDTVQATDMLYLVVDVPKALGEMRRVLKEGGALVASVPCMWPPSEAAGWARRVARLARSPDLRGPPRRLGCDRGHHPCRGLARGPEVSPWRLTSSSSKIRPSAATGSTTTMARSRSTGPTIPTWPLVCFSGAAMTRSSWTTISADLAPGV